jgi:hypothetical protein
LTIKCLDDILGLPKSEFLSKLFQERGEIGMNDVGFLWGLEEE